MNQPFHARPIHPRIMTLALGGVLLLTACQPIQLSTPATTVTAEGSTAASLPVIQPVVETQTILDVEDDTETLSPVPADARTGDADDPAIWVHPADPDLSLVICALKDGGLDVYGLDGELLQSVSPAGVRYNNVDVTYGFLLDGTPVDIAVATDRYGDKLALFAIDPATRELRDVTAAESPLVYTPPGQESDEETTAYGLALYRSTQSGIFYAFVTRRATSEFAQLELVDNGSGQISYRVVRTIPLPAPGGDLDPQAEGMVADEELGQLYVAQEDVGIWKFAAEPTGSNEGILIDRVAPAGDRLVADAEGLTIYYAADGKGYLLASSQGDNRFNVYSREGDNQYMGSFLIGEESTDPANTALDGVQASDGAQVLNLALGSRYPHGLLVVHDGSNQPELIALDDGEEENVATNFKFVPWEAVAAAFVPPLTVDTTSYDPRGLAMPSATTTTTPTAGFSAAVGAVSAIYTLPDLPLAEVQNTALPASITNDRGILLGGIGSDLWHDAAAPAHEFWMITDRGPNGQIEVDDKNRRTFPVPEFTPHILQVRAEDGVLTVLQTLPILTPDGEAVTGLSNLEGITEQGWDYTAQTKLDFNPNGLDSEGLVRTHAGDFWLVEEYGPSLLHVDAAGKVVKRYVPAGIDYSSASYPIAGTLPAIYALRQNNRGFEGLALSPDETTLFIVLQSPLSNPDEETAELSRNTRLLAFDIASEQPVAEYVYSFDDPAGYGDPDEPDEMKLSGVVALSDTVLLVLERTDKVAKLYTVDLAGATNILATPWDDPATAPSIELLADPMTANVVPLPKTLVIDLGLLPEVPQKIEGVAVLDNQTVAIANDNDFNLGEFDADGNNSAAPGVQSHLLIVELAAPFQ